VSQENVELMRRGIERFNRGDEDDALLADFYDPDAVYHSREDEPDTGVYRGREAIRGLMRMWRDMFSDFSFDVDEYIDAGDVLVMSGWVRVRAHGSDADIREPYNWVVKMRSGRVVEVHEYRTKDEALKAAGLEE
jgi:ketosteroid isomerase-like protein